MKDISKLNLNSYVFIFFDNRILIRILAIKYIYIFFPSIFILHNFDSIKYD